MKFEAYKCDSCGDIMKNEKDGFEFFGNVTYLGGGGLIGSSDPEKAFSDGKSFHHCIPCVIRMLNLQHKAVPRSPTLD